MLARGDGNMMDHNSVIDGRWKVCLLRSSARVRADAEAKLGSRCQGCMDGRIVNEENFR